jgi:hypothetical protein
LPGFFVAAFEAEGDRHAVILTGSGGEPLYTRTFTDWGDRLERLLIEEAEIPEGNIARIGDDLSTRTIPVSLGGIETVFEEMKTKIQHSDELLIFLIGHGSYIAGESRFNIPGKDLTAEGLAGMLENIEVSRLILVNTTASSAGFINALSGRDRIIVTATKSVNERNATRFMESFLQGLEDGSADRNRDGRISLLEASRQAAHLTGDWFERQGYLLTEHPLIDDNGDALGSRLIPEEAEGPMAVEMPLGEGVVLDGSLAGRYFLKDFSFPPEVPDELARRYTDALDEVERIKGLKSEKDATAYRANLEPLLIEAARAHREIRRIINALESDIEAGPQAVPDSSRKAETAPNVPRQ